MRALRIFSRLHFGQAVDALGEQVRARVRHLVPALEHRRVLQAEIGGEVDDLHAGAEQLARLRHRDAVRRREEHEVALAQPGLVGLDERQRVVAAAQAREHVDDARPGVLARRDRAHGDLRMLREEPQELDPGVPGAADDADVDHHASVIRRNDSSNCARKQKAARSAAFRVTRKCAA
jgi:hypothetical protein